MGEAERPAAGSLDRARGRHVIAETIGRRLGIPAAPVPTDEAEQRFGFLAPFVGMDNPASSHITRELLGWEPARPGLLAALEQGPSLDPRSIQD